MLLALWHNLALPPDHQAGRTHQVHSRANVLCDPGKLEIMSFVWLDALKVF